MNAAMTGIQKIGCQVDTGHANSRAMPARKEEGFSGPNLATNFLYSSHRSIHVLDSARMNICEIEQLFSAKKYAARTHLFSINGGKIISVHNTIS